MTRIDVPYRRFPQREMLLACSVVTLRWSHNLYTVNPKVQGQCRHRLIRLFGDNRQVCVFNMPIVIWETVLSCSDPVWESKLLWDFVAVWMSTDGYIDSTASYCPRIWFGVNVGPWCLVWSEFNSVICCHYTGCSESLKLLSVFSVYMGASEEGAVGWGWGGGILLSRAITDRYIFLFYYRYLKKIIIISFSICCICRGFLIWEKG